MMSLPDLLGIVTSVFLIFVGFICFVQAYHELDKEESAWVSVGSGLFFWGVSITFLLVMAF